MITEISSVGELLEVKEIDIVQLNIARRIATLQENLKLFVKGLSKHTRNAATHIWVVMISPEERNQKPYALPVQCLSYTGMTTLQARQLVNKIVRQMHNHGMDVAGM